MKIYSYLRRVLLQRLLLMFVLVYLVRAQSSTAVQTGLYSIRYKTICTCLMPQLDSSVTIACSNTSEDVQINILNAYIFDAGALVRTDDNCTLKSTQLGVIKYVTSNIQDLCSATSNCSMSYLFFINLVTQIQTIQCLSANIIYDCIEPSSQKSYTDSSFAFTNIFYILSLVLSSSCIILGALFIIRRFYLIHRRRRAYADSTAQTRRCRSRPGGCGAETQSPDGSGVGGVWTTSSIYPPPPYDHINEFQVAHLNTPPPYESAAAIVKTKPQAAPVFIATIDPLGVSVPNQPDLNNSTANPNSSLTIDPDAQQRSLSNDAPASMGGEATHSISQKTD